MRHVLITGGAGFIGSNLTRHLSKVGGYRISVFDNESEGDLGHVADYAMHCIRGDILDEDALAAALEGVDVVVHLAADTGVLQSIEDPEHGFRANAFGTFQLLKLARAAGVSRVLNASTGGAILGEVPPPAHEDIVPRPVSPYGASKLAAEGYCAAFAGSYGLSTASLRFSNVYGPGSYHKGSVVAAFFKRLLEGKRLTVYGDGSQTRDFLFVGDLAEGIRLAIESEAQGVYQLGSGRPTSLIELLDEMRQTIGDFGPVEVDFEAFRTGEIRATWCDISKARRALEFDPRTPLQDGLRQTWAWFRQAYGAG